MDEIHIVEKTTRTVENKPVFWALTKFNIFTN